MGGIYGCGCKEVYRFPHTTYPYSSCICSFFCSSIPTFCSFLKCFSFLYIIIYIYIGKMLHSSPVSVGLAQARPNNLHILAILCTIVTALLSNFWFEY